MFVDKDVYVSMRDGVRICIDIYRPDKDGRYPALCSLGSPGKELQAMHAWLPRKNGPATCGTVSWRPATSTT